LLPSCRLRVHVHLARGNLRISSGVVRCSLLSFAPPPLRLDLLPKIAHDSPCHYVDRHAHARKPLCKWSHTEGPPIHVYAFSASSLTQRGRPYMNMHIGSGSSSCQHHEAPDASRESGRKGGWSSFALAAGQTVRVMDSPTPSTHSLFVLRGVSDYDEAHPRHSTDPHC